MAKFRVTHFVLQRVQTHKTVVLVHKKLARNCVARWTIALQWAFKHSS